MSKEKPKYAKPSLNLEKQIEKLEDNGLVIDDKQKAEDISNWLNYFRLRAYWYPFCTD